MTIKEARSEVLLRLYKGKPSDDIQVDDRQVDSWLSRHKNRLLVLYSKQNGGDIPPVSAKRYDCIPSKLETPVCVSKGCHSRFYIDLPVSVLQLKDDTGIHRLFTQGGVEFFRFNAGSETILQHLKYSKPTEDRPAWYRIQDKIYLIGSEIEGSLFSLDLVPSDLSAYDENDELPLPSGLLSDLIDLCVQDGLQQLQSLNDLKDDGKE